MSELKQGQNVIVTDANGNEYQGVLVNVNDYREPSLKYAVDIGLDDFVFVGDKYIRALESDVN